MPQAGILAERSMKLNKSAEIRVLFCADLRAKSINDKALVEGIV